VFVGAIRLRRMVTQKQDILKGRAGPANINLYDSQFSGFLFFIFFINRLPIIPYRTVKSKFGLPPRADKYAYFY
jgi:hypothetical protein